ncbi:MAG: nucleotide exchange factor GrpE [Campylobacteraceae bacterium]|nr:nucleotide exchange factor GrpE [Campylobacteraceae bacterium]MBT3883087.1 nucleotide exchange factor GrpE [Campylobacteraceae bacterium]MBT4030184.1 nucleotide exchange factor GrpE [Campylobacteraceae bacterium]MBT4178756.1 nucleotide exchange factor GrpE [Campylobacteraceae bacterium]MBT4572718.1 nucleotide exchange factor GrpE [Campylobacteraceae bacterium]
MSEEVKNEEIVEEVCETENCETTEETVEITEEEKFASLDEEYKSVMEAKVAAAEAKALEAEDKFLRTHADFENIKKRLEREKYQAIDFASEKFAKDLLAPIDALQMALISANGDFDAKQVVDKLKEGIELTVKSFNTAFEKHNIVEVEYDEFNPEHHNAVMQVDSDDVQSGQIVMVMQKGYTLKDRLLREAMVSVAN